MIILPPDIINKLIIMKLSLEPTPSAKCIHWHCEKYERTVEAFVLDIYYTEPTIWDKKTHTCLNCKLLRTKQ